MPNHSVYTKQKPIHSYINGDLPHKQKQVQVKILPTHLMEYLSCHSLSSATVGSEAIKNSWCGSSRAPSKSHWVSITYTGVQARVSTLHTMALWPGLPWRRCCDGEGGSYMLFMCHYSYVTSPVHIILQLVLLLNPSELFIWVITGHECIIHNNQ